ncbi:MAG TPA: DUF3179 domain-containing protein [Actinomycetota bacterium]|nr:DUF3179 domain-containing protein [Actinomycetota bacterium]
MSGHRFEPSLLRAGGASLAVAFLVLLSACSRPAPGAPGTSGRTPLVDPAEIISGGPPPDGIPPIDDPKFLDASRVDFLSPQEPVISLVWEEDTRAYPAQIMVWHEIVNDTVGGVPVTVTYCPLCNTGIAFRRPVIDGKLLDFGTSGKLYHSNLVMYDRQTESLWPQALGQAVTGQLTGTKLELVPVQMVAWEDWLAEHPHGKVLSRDTGVARPYGQNPYEGYDDPDSTPFLFQGTPDPRLPPKARVVGVQVGSDVVAFPYDRLQAVASGGWATVSATVGGRSVVVFWKAGAVSAVDQATISESRSVGSTGVFYRRLDGRLLMFHGTAGGISDEQTGSTWDIFGRAVGGPLEGRSLNMVISIESFWFDWAAFHPHTRIYGR